MTSAPRPPSPQCEAAARARRHRRPRSSSSATRGSLDIVRVRVRPRAPPARRPPSFGLLRALSVAPCQWLHCRQSEVSCIISRSVPNLSRNVATVVPSVQSVARKNVVSGARASTASISRRKALSGLRPMERALSVRRTCTPTTLAAVTSTASTKRAGNLASTASTGSKVRSTSLRTRHASGASGRKPFAWPVVPWHGKKSLHACMITHRESSCSSTRLPVILCAC